MSSPAPPPGVTVCRKTIAKPNDIQISGVFLLHTRERRKPLTRISLNAIDSWTVRRMAV
jgi:hypothetical protein